MNDRSSKTMIYVGIFLVALFIGGNIIGYAFTGLITLASFVFLCESVPTLKWIVQRTTHLLDIMMFCFALYSKVHFGVNIAMALTFATLGFTLVYAPYVRDCYNRDKHVDKHNKK